MQHGRDDHEVEIADALPPVNAFWSATLYKLPASLLFATAAKSCAEKGPITRECVLRAGKAVHEPWKLPAAKLLDRAEAGGESRALEKMTHFVMEAAKLAAAKALPKPEAA
mgnify:CR=1 FL=1